MYHSITLKRLCTPQNDPEEHVHNRTNNRKRWKTLIPIPKQILYPPNPLKFPLLLPSSIRFTQSKFKVVFYLYYLKDVWSAAHYEPVVSGKLHSDCCYNDTRHVQLQRKQISFHKLLHLKQNNLDDRYQTISGL